MIEGDEHRLSLKINYRYPVTKGYADCAPILNGKFTSAGFALDSEVHKAKLYVPEDSPLVSTLLRVYREQTGLEGQPKSIAPMPRRCPTSWPSAPSFPVRKSGSISRTNTFRWTT